MPTEITSREVLNCLNYLGYNNINAMQLKEFVQDLKKLIKYEERKKFAGNFQNESGEKQMENSSCRLADNESEKLPDTKDADTKKPRNPIDIFQSLYSHSTLSSKAKIVPKKESVISLYVRKNRCIHSCIQHNKENVISEESEDKFADAEEVELDTNPFQNKSNVVIDKKPTNVCKSKSSFIRPVMLTSQKSDPVALYHQYKAGWQRQKIPGECQRANLRWAVREKMLSRPRVGL
ncbi:hypothetical protein Zmor_027030 [Zophobas morio]|uniref:Centriolar and ciliogenesis-associated protein HYLS1 C-terminal domain-containing protein n=1 Tax=Zophobas morio TaxID=2755281 RepID=A0AA38HUM2_9CUCU|nr:hypothetical protein Zmor_027030 [Zophobas morio]